MLLVRASDPPYVLQDHLICELKQLDLTRPFLLNLIYRPIIFYIFIVMSGSLNDFPCAGLFSVSYCVDCKMFRFRMRCLIKIPQSTLNQRTELVFYKIHVSLQSLSRAHDC